MKVATLKNGTRDGQLVLVSRDLSRCIEVEDLARTLQFALDDWDNLSPRLESRYKALNEDPSMGVAFDPTRCESPLPRSYQWADGSAYINHVELVRRARGAEVPESFYSDPLMYQGASDGFFGPRDPIELTDYQWGYDMEAEIAVITDDVELGTTPEQAAKHIKLIMLLNDISLRNLIPAELAKGFGFFQSKPPTAFSPVAVTLDEIEDYWTGRTIDLPMRVDLNGEPFGRAEAGTDATFGLTDLIAHVAKTRSLSAGSIIGSGTISNRGPDGGPGKPISEGGKGYSCIAEIRMIETILNGAPSTPFLKSGDRVRIEMLDKEGASVFGAIDQSVEQV